MQFQYTQCYLVKTKENLSYFFYLNQDRNLSVRSYTPENELLQEEQISTKKMLDFSVAIDRRDQLHLVCIGEDSGLYYYIRHKKQWSHRLISKLDTLSNRYQNLCFLIHRQDSHVFYTKTNLTNPMVAAIEHLHWNEKQITRKTVSNYLPGKEASPPQIQLDSLGNIHIIYKVLYRNNHQLYYSHFTFLSKKWRNPEMITRPQEDHTHPNILIDNRDNLHLVWSTVEDNNQVVKYQKKIQVASLKSKWTPCVTLFQKNTNTTAPLLFQESTQLKVLAKQGQWIVEVSSENYGDNWRTPEQPKVHKVSKPLAVRYLTNQDLEKVTLSVHYLFFQVGESLLAVGTNLYQAPQPQASPQQPAASPPAKEPDDPPAWTPAEEKAPPVEKAPEPELPLDVPAPSPTEPAEEPETPLPPESEPETIQADPPVSEAEQEPATEPVSEATEAQKIPPEEQGPSEALLPEDTILLDQQLKELVQEIQSYINQVLQTLDRMETAPQPAAAPVSSLHPVPATAATPLGSPLIIQRDIPDFHRQLARLNEQLADMENQQFHLQKELNDYQKKIYDMEDVMVHFKKQILEAETRAARLNELPPNLLGRIKNIFK